MLVVRRVLGAAGVGLALFSLLCIFMGLGEILGLSPSKQDLGTNIGVLIFFIGVTASFTWLAFWGLGKPKGSPDEPDPRSVQIRQILSLAKNSAGELTLLQVAAETSLSIDQSRELLEELVTEGISQMSVDEDGVLLYAFPDFQRHTTDRLPPA